MQLINQAINSLSSIGLSRLSELGYICIVTIIMLVLCKYVLQYFQKIKNNDWLRSLGLSLTSPSRWLIIGYGLFTLLEALFRNEKIFQERILQGRAVFSVIILTWAIFQWKKIFEQIFKEKFLRKSSNKQSDLALISAISKVISTAIVSIVILVVLDTIGVPLQALMAFGGVSGIAVSWAAKDIIANFFGGLMVYINRPFIIGDWIKSPNKNFEGTVEDIGWYMTRICTFEKRPMYIPNAMMTDAIIENPGRMYNRRIKVTIPISYRDFKKIKPLTDKIETMLKENNEIDQEQTLMVHLLTFDPYSLGVEIYCFTKTTDWKEYRRIQQEVFLNVTKIIEEQKAHIAISTDRTKPQEITL